jgi:hypothetical protein
MTYIVKISGSPSRTVAAEYECPAHGRFETDVERNEQGDAPDVIPCRVELLDDYFCGDPPALCMKPSEWRISAPMTRVRRIEAIKGKSQKPERETWTDTRNIAEGQPLHEWWDDRAAVWERRRQQDVVAFAREHNERIRSDD